MFVRAKRVLINLRVEQTLRNMFYMVQFLSKALQIITANSKLVNVFLIALTLNQKIFAILLFFFLCRDFGQTGKSFSCVYLIIRYLRHVKPRSDLVCWTDTLTNIFIKVLFTVKFLVCEYNMPRAFGKTVIVKINEHVKSCSSTSKNIIFPPPQYL